MQFRSRVRDEKQVTTSRPIHDDGATALEGPVRLDWAAAEVTSYRLFFPEPYVAAYAYPLIVYIHDDSRSDADLSRWFPEVSGQNFLSAAVRAPFPVASGMPGRYSWSGEPRRIARKLVAEAVDSISSLWNIHAGRIFLMGEGLGASLAVEMVLTRPIYCGAVAIAPGGLPDIEFTANPAKPKRFLLVQDSAGAPNSNGQTAPNGTCHDVTTLGFTKTNGKTKLCREINRWLMKSIPGTIW